jgi:hypothetical protein
MGRDTDWTPVGSIPNRDCSVQIGLGAHPALSNGLKRQGHEAGHSVLNRNITFIMSDNLAARV